MSTVSCWLVLKLHENYHWCEGEQSGNSLNTTENGLPQGWQDLKYIIFFWSSVIKMTSYIWFPVGQLSSSSHDFKLNVINLKWLLFNHLQKNCDFISSCTTIKIATISHHLSWYFILNMTVLQSFWTPTKLDLGIHHIRQHRHFSGLSNVWDKTAELIWNLIYLNFHWCTSELFWNSFAKEKMITTGNEG